jgi:hypothetical protein
MDKRFEEQGVGYLYKCITFWRARETTNSAFMLEICQLFGIGVKQDLSLTMSCGMGESEDNSLKYIRALCFLHKAKFVEGYHRENDRDNNISETEQCIRYATRILKKISKSNSLVLTLLGDLSLKSDPILAHDYYNQAYKVSDQNIEAKTKMVAIETKSKTEIVLNSDELKTQIYLKDTFSKDRLMVLYRPSSAFFEFDKTLHDKQNTKQNTKLPTISAIDDAKKESKHSSNYNTSDSKWQ